MNQELKTEIQQLLLELQKASYKDIEEKIRYLAEFIHGAMGSEESDFIFNVINEENDDFVRRKTVLSRLKGRMHNKDWQIVLDTPEYVPTSKSLLPPNKSVFIVHGHDDAAREAVARFIEKLGLTAIILHEQANMSQTVIEKLERHSDVKFAVVLLTPDDIGTGRNTPELLKRRARQNVLIELGYFVGKLGRSNVCTLRVEDTEIPSDFSGVVYTDMDKSGGWRTKLAQELVSAKFTIDLTALVS